MMRTARTRKRRGFTLIELMVVLVILALLATVVTTSVVGKSEEARAAKAQTEIAVIETLLDQFYLHMGRYPATEEGLRVLYFPPEEGTEDWKGPYSKKPITPDPWKNPYIYECPGTHTSQPYEVSSLGKDGEEGGIDYDADITSWVVIEGEEY